MLTIKVYKPDMEIPQSYIVLAPVIYSHFEVKNDEKMEVVQFRDHTGVNYIEQLPRGCKTEIYAENEVGRTVQAYKAPPIKAAKAA